MPGFSAERALRKGEMERNDQKPRQEHRKPLPSPYILIVIAIGKRTRDIDKNHGTGPRRRGRIRTLPRSSVLALSSALFTRVDVAVDCPVEIPAWLMGLCGFLGDLSCA